MEVWLEGVKECHQQLNELLKEEFASTKGIDGLPPLHVDWPTYITLCRRGELLLFTARDENDKLLGFAMYYIHRHLQHMDHTNAACVTLLVKMDQRGKGVGKALMHEAEAVLKDRGVNYVTHQFRTCYDVEPLFPKLGYRLVEYAYMKELN
jgi:GNAT superfamily N-acetyltransferase